MSTQAKRRKATSKPVKRKAAKRAPAKAAKPAAKQTAKTSRSRVTHGVGARTRLIDYALTLPGAYEDNPWGERVAKVHKKVFLFGGVEPSRGGTINFYVKLPDSGRAVLDLPFAEPAGYGLGKSGWVALKFGWSEEIPLELVEAWIRESYRAIAPKKLVRELEPE